jgi:hypothetical protein
MFFKISVSNGNKCTPPVKNPTTFIISDQRTFWPYLKNIQIISDGNVVFTESHQPSIIKTHVGAAWARVSVHGSDFLQNRFFDVTQRRGNVSLHVLSSLRLSYTFLDPTFGPLIASKCNIDTEFSQPLYSFNSPVEILF